MTEKDRLLYRLFVRVREHGYYHQVDVALMEWFSTNASVKEICAKHLITPDAMYQQKSRLLRKKADS